MLILLFFLISPTSAEAGSFPSGRPARGDSFDLIAMLTAGTGEAPVTGWQKIASIPHDYSGNPSWRQKEIFMMASTDGKEIAGTEVSQARIHQLAQIHQPAKQGVTAPRPSTAKVDPTGLSCVDCPEIVPIPDSKFAIGKYAVTFAEWDKCVADGGCGGYQPPDNGWGRGNRPVINVNWNDAKAYVDWLSSKTGKLYRLPTAEEWETAARAGSATNYYWGNDVGRNNANCDGCGSEWDNRKTAPVGSFKPNAFGLYDMMGNVWQWTDSCWKDNCARRLFVGGSWNHRPEDMRPTTRNWFDTSKRMRYLGFRVAITLP